MLRYVSTRGLAEPRPFSDILIDGLAPDGGLYLPESYPQLDLAALRGADYATVATEVLTLLAPDRPAAEIAALCRETYSPDVFRNARRDEDPQAITPVRRLADGLYLQSLANGPTLAFKDLALQLVGRLFERELAARGQTLNVLGATSGDTGVAAEEALRGRQDVQIFMLTPAGRMSPFQAAQTYSVSEANVHNLALAGTFDDCQDVVKALSGDLAFKRRRRLGAVNSINWARVAAQVAYYAYGWAQVSGAGPVSFCVPSGNFGNALAGYVAKRMGLPIARLIVASNENDVLDRFFRSGRYCPQDVRQTSSPSMDISKASNFERLIHDLVGPERTRALFAKLEEKGAFDLSGCAGADGDELATARAWGFASGVATDDDRLEAIRSVFAADGVVIDPHTAAAVHVARARPGAEPVIVFETAQAAKFAETIRLALGHDPERPPAFVDLEERPQRLVRLPAEVGAVRAYLEAHVDADA